MDVEDAAQLIWAEAQQGRYFPEALRGQLSLDDGLRIQLNILERRKAEGQQHAGWKIGLTSARVRARFGTDDQPFGHIMEHRVLASGAQVACADILNCGVEPELCFTIGETLQGPGVTADQARGAVASVCAGFEINESRSDGVSDFTLTVADNMAQWGIVMGESLQPVPADFDFDGLVVEMRRGGEVQASSVGRDVIDDHYRSLTVLANTLGQYGVALEAGQRVITGSYTKHDAAPGETWRADFAGIGSVEVSFT